MHDIFHTIDNSHKLSLKELVSNGEFGFDWSLQSSPLAKTIALMQYYINRFGAKIARNRTLFFDEIASQNLINEFLGGLPYEQ